MMRSLFSGVSGLKIHQTKMDVIGNNISNVNTVAYKANSVTFSEVFYQTTQSASGYNPETGKGGTNAQQIGLGSSVASISTNTNEGANQRTDNAFDLKMNGSAYFVVESNGERLFTRAGNFKTDDAGNLVTATGALVMGWQVNDDGQVIKDTVSALRPKSTKFSSTAPQATTNFTVTGNINKNDDNFIAGKPVPMTVRFYDSLGFEYNASVNLLQNPTDSTQYTLSLGEVYCDGRLTNLVGDVTLGTGNILSFDRNTGLPGASGQDENGADVFEMVMTLRTGTRDEVGGGELTDEEWGDVVMVTTDINPIAVDYGGITCRAGEGVFTAAFGKQPSGEGAGKAPGRLIGISVQDDGKIVGNYNNGDVKVLCQIAVASFFNPNGLEKVGDNYYRATLNSGLFNGIGDDVTAVGGSVKSGVLEMSNVDLANEFTEMITTQRGFQANSRIITVSDTLIEELVNLKR